MLGLVKNISANTLWVAIACSAGCATQATLTVSSQPEGAYITEVETGRVFGMAPVVTIYDPAVLNMNKNQQGCYLVKGFEAKWVSGATSILSPITLCGSNVGAYNITLTRDADYTDLEKDLQFAIQLQSLQAQKQQAKAASDAAAAALWSAWTSEKQNKIDCRTTPIGDSVYTHCR